METKLVFYNYKGFCKTVPKKMSDVYMATNSTHLKFWLIPKQMYENMREGF